jgi:hypothetical protein
MEKDQLKRIADALEEILRLVKKIKKTTNETYERSRR